MSRMRRWIVPLVTACLVGLPAQRALGQSTVVTGKVTDDHGTAIPGASVAIQALHLGAVTNEAGDCEPPRIARRFRYMSFARPLDASRLRQSIGSSSMGAVLAAPRRRRAQCLTNGLSEIGHTAPIS
jgi:hypothetical protein